MSSLNNYNMKPRFCASDNFENTYICDICHMYIVVPREYTVYECIYCKNPFRRIISKFYNEMLQIAVNILKFINIL